MRSRLQRLKDGGTRGHSGRERKSGFPALQIGDRLLETYLIRVGLPNIGMASNRLTRLITAECR